MKILLLGEFSALYKNLKEGLLELGQEVTLFANGDDWKQIDGADGYLFNKKSKYISSIKVSKRFEGYDVVQVVNPLLYSKWINNFLLSRIKSNNDKFVLSAAGIDYYLYKAYKENKFQYYAFDDYPQIDKTFKSVPRGIMRTNIDKKIVKISDAIIPISYEYLMAHGQNPKCKKIILMPINCEKIPYIENKINNKIVFFHGITRSSLKGSRYIIQALENIKNKYPNDVKVIMVEKLPYKEYLKAIYSANIILDQCLSYGYGMNAIHSLAAGKVVFTGAEKAALDAIGVRKVPFFNLIPDVKEIQTELEKLIEERKNIPQLGYESRKYAETYHSHIKIAQDYLKIWNEV